MQLTQRYYVGKLGISATTMGQALELLDGQVRSQTSAYVCAANLEAAALAQRDRAFCEIQNRSFLTLPDGMPLVWCAWIQGRSGVERVTGPDLMLEVLRASVRRGYTHYFYGDTPETLSNLERVLKDRFPGVIIKGMYSPPFRELDEEELHKAAEEINRLKPSFVWIALGCPKQERWAADVLPRIEAATLVGVGAAFRFLLGEYRHPPRIWQLFGLEGVFWRGARHPVMGLKWYSRHLPICAWFLLDAARKRIQQAWHRGCL